jgi:hypothetical protein
MLINLHCFGHRHSHTQVSQPLRIRAGTERAIPRRRALAAGSLTKEARWDNEIPICASLGRRAWEPRLRGGAVELWPLRYRSVLVSRQQGRALGELPWRLADRHPVERLWVLLSLRSGPVLLPSPNLNGSKHMTEVCKFPRSARSKFSPKKEHKRITNHPRRWDIKNKPEVKCWLANLGRLSKQTELCSEANLIKFKNQPS